MKQLRSALPVLAILISNPSSASAWDCDVPPLDVALRQATAILTGQVTRMEVTEVAGVVRVTVNVRETFKGEHNSTFTIYSYTRSTVSYEFRIGREYIVFARGNDSPTVAELPRTGQIAYLCGGTAELHSADGKRRLSEVRERLKPKGEVGSDVTALASSHRRPCRTGRAILT